MANQFGVLKPEYLARAATAVHDISHHSKMASRASAMARHPAGRSRSAEFHSQVKAHLAIVNSATQTLNSDKPQPAERLTDGFRNNANMS